MKNNKRLVNVIEKIHPALTASICTIIVTACSYALTYLACQHSDMNLQIAIGMVVFVMWSCGMYFIGMRYIEK